VAVASAIPESIPSLGILVGIFAVAGDTVVITANQIKLVLQIAGIYGFKPDFIDRMAELLPLTGGAFCMRTIAREVAGFIPMGGPVIKGAIAYAGTYLIGRLAWWYYKDGKKLTREEKKKIFDNAITEAMCIIDKFSEKWKKEKK